MQKCRKWQTIRKYGSCVLRTLCVMQLVLLEERNEQMLCSLAKNVFDGRYSSIFWGFEITRSSHIPTNIKQGRKKKTRRIDQSP